MFRIHPLILQNEYKFQIGILMAQSEKNPVTLIPWLLQFLSGHRNQTQLHDKGRRVQGNTAIPSFSAVTQNKESVTGKIL